MKYKKVAKEFPPENTRVLVRKISLSLCEYFGEDDEEDDLIICDHSEYFLAMAVPKKVCEDGRSKIEWFWVTNTFGGLEMRIGLFDEYSEIDILPKGKKKKWNEKDYHDWLNFDQSIFPKNESVYEKSSYFGNI